ncbi:hypothetical protein MUK42_11276 [Musa troglodytarum]|uniref:Uncharacterized protein n=1 Tax=Musa troglodytarum TaxID=320322 RepID=A0A9E7GLF7_9LILI|nr:hypothetical protein MUK42_11276 [Musa troglodytarum]
MEKGSGFLLREQQVAKGEGSREEAQYFPQWLRSTHGRGLSHRHERDIWARGRVRHFRFSGGKGRERVFNRAGTPIQSGICLLPPLARESELSAAATGALQGGPEIHAEASGRRIPCIGTRMNLKLYG